jgi:signal transduction histidine kinase
MLIGLRPRLPRIRSLQARFLAINVPLVLFATAVLFGVFELTAHHRAMNELRDKLARVCEGQAELLSDSLWTLDRDRVQLILASIDDDPDVRGAVVHDDMGNRLARIGRLPDSPEGPLVARRTIRYDGPDGPEVVGRLTLALTDRRVVHGTEQRIMLAGLLAGLLMLAAVLSALVANRWTIGIPLQRLLDSIDRTESGGVRHAVEWHSHDEIGAVVKAFNQMQARQQRYESALRAARDELERRVAERTAELARARDAAEAANKAKTGFLANMSHELRTPLNAIIGFAEVLHNEVLGPIGNTRYRDYAGDIRESGTHLLELINDLLDLSKAEAGKLELNETLVDLHEAAATTLAMVEPRAEAGGVYLYNALPQRLPAVQADDRKIKQVLLNLLTNAIKFTPAGGTVRLEAAVKDGPVELAVADTGIGIAEDDIARIMEPFAQVDSSLARRYEGTGLGLPLVKSLMELHGGELTIASTPGTGTRVAVRLPADRVVAADAPAAAQAS